MLSSSKFVIVLNETVPIGNLLSASAQIAMSLVRRASREETELMQFKSLEFVDISLCSVVILKATGNQLRTLRAQAQQQEILYSIFTDTMTFSGINEDLLEKTQNTKDEDFNYFGVGLFALKEKLTPLTKKFSLWK